MTCDTPVTQAGDNPLSAPIRRSRLAEFSRGKRLVDA